MTSAHTPLRAERILLRTFAAAAAAIGLVTLIVGALRIRLYLVAAAEGGAPVSLLTDVPLPGVPSGGEPEIVFGAFPTADLLVNGLSNTSRALLAIGEGLGVLVVVLVSAAIGWLMVATSLGRPFARSLQAHALIAGATLSVGSMVGQAVAGFGKMNAALELNAATDDFFRVGFAFDPAPIAVGFALMSLAFVFRAGARLQRETEGLV